MHARGDSVILVDASYYVPVFPTRRLQRNVQLNAVSPSLRHRQQGSMMGYLRCKKGLWSVKATTSVNNSPFLRDRLLICNRKKLSVSMESVAMDRVDQLASFEAVAYLMSHNGGQ